MSRNDEPTTVAEILEMEPSRGRDKSWVGGPFTAIVKNAKERRPRSGGRAFYTCELEDPENSNNYLEATADIEFTRMEGSLVEVSGQGISREEYNGKPQVKMGRNAMVQVVSAGGGGSSRSSEPRNTQPPAREQSAPASGGEDRPYGPAVGGAVETAATAIMAMDKPPQPGTPEFAKLLWEVASDVFRVNHLLQSSFKKLAAKASDRADPEGARNREDAARKKAEEEAKRRAEEEERQRQAEREANQEADPEEDDVPF
jgi:hypothetical protein